MKPEILKVLCCSTAHLEFGVDTLVLDAMERNAPHGWLVWTGHAQGLKEDGYGAGLVGCLEKANELGCEYVLFDADGFALNDVPTFDASWPEGGSLAAHEEAKHDPTL